MSNTVHMTAGRNGTPRASARKRIVAGLSSIALIVGVLAAGPSYAATAPEAQALGGPVLMADLSKFQPGNIISDATFFNRGTMTEAQIQAFLESKVPRCEPGYTCLRDWYDTSRAPAADAMCGAYPGGFRERASAIIYKVAQACGINPQVLLVMLQKEQGLVTHVWPSEFRYTIAMGQGCPDTAGCDTRYYGFFNQVYGAAWQLKRYANPPGTSQYFTWYAPGRVWNVRFHPNAACGTAPVLIENQATANLYYYTPYQPNAAALAAGYAAANDACSSYGNRNFYNYFTDWFGSTVSIDPFGNIELAESVPGGFRLRGWAADPSTTDPIEVHVYVGATGYAFRAELDRPDVGAAHPGIGSRHGFDVRVPATSTAPVSICVYGINVGQGSNTRLGCVTRSGMTGSPIGAFESAKTGDGAVVVSGWAIDPDTAASTEVHVYVGASGSSLRADLARPDVAASYPAYGANHGFRATIRAVPGTYQVCAYGINVGAGANVALGCRSVTVTGAPDAGRAPLGAFEGLSISGDVATASGWTVDPDTAAPIAVQLTVNGTARTAITANLSRPDVAAAYPALGGQHGFVEKFTMQPGRNEVCVTALNNAAGANTSLGCRTVTVAEPDRGRDPIGNFESLTLSGDVATAAGWAIDPDTAAPIAVHLYVNGAGREYIADKSRPDVAAAYPASGAAHGFVQKLTLAAGRSEVCAYAINSGRGSNTTLGCRVVTVATAAPVDQGRVPLGFFESVVPAAGGAAIAGWALDPDTTGPIEVHVYVGSVGRAYVANKLRPDVGAAYRLGDNHGFSEVVPLPAGTHRICVYAINSGAGANPMIGCREVTIP